MIEKERTTQCHINTNKEVTGRDSYRIKSVQEDNFYDVEICFNEKVKKKEEKK